MLLDNISSYNDEYVFGGDHLKLSNERRSKNLEHLYGFLGFENHKVFLYILVQIEAVIRYRRM